MEKLAFIRNEKIGHNILFETPSFIKGHKSTERPLLHLDYTASAQGLNFIENYIQKLMAFYANTHTETSDEFGDVEFIGYLGGSYEKFYGEISGVTNVDDVDWAAKAGVKFTF